MTEDKDFKKVVRERSAKTGESHSAARRMLAGESGNQDLTVVRNQLAYAFTLLWQEFRPALRGLTDDEYLWQPVANCPTIHSQPDGTYRCDAQFPVGGAASVAQRLCWIAQITRVRTNQHFGDKSVVAGDVASVPGTAKAGVEWLGEAVAAWAAGLAAADPTLLTRHSENLSPGSMDGQFLFVDVVWHHLQLLAQCTSQVSLLRDIYLAQRPDVVSAR